MFSSVKTLSQDPHQAMCKGLFSDRLSLLVNTLRTTALIRCVILYVRHANIDICIYIHVYMIIYVYIYTCIYIYSYLSTSTDNTLDSL